VLTSCCKNVAVLKKSEESGAAALSISIVGRVV